MTVGALIGRHIVYRRQQLGMSRATLARASGLSTSLLSRLERGLLQDISVTSLLSLTYCLNLRLSDMFGEYLAADDKLSLKLLELDKQQRLDHRMAAMHRARR
jgi:transcriptional regulator with XRE-family HTH domain